MLFNCISDVSMPHKSHLCVLIVQEGKTVLCHSSLYHPPPSAQKKRLPERNASLWPEERVLVGDTQLFTERMNAVCNEEWMSALNALAKYRTKAI